MKDVKFKSLSFFFSSLLILISSCSKESSCTPRPFTENIIGTWTMSYSLQGVSASGKATFNSDGTYSTIPPELLITIGNNPIKTYTITGQNIQFKATSGIFSLALDGQLISNECISIAINIPSLNSIINLTK
jgi:hypothetical protein